jgi:hypothetical protein
MIFSLEIDNTINFNIKNITKYILEYFKDLLGTSDDRLVSLDSILWEEATKLTSESRVSLE